MEISNLTDKQKSTPLFFEFGSDVPFAYANYEDCRRYDIEPIPWLWGEYWVRERIDHHAKIIGHLVNRPDGTFIKIYKRINQPHPFYNIINQPEPLPWHIPLKTISITRLKQNGIFFDQLISWGGLEYLADVERSDLLINLSSLLTHSGSIVLSYKHFFNLSHDAFLFFNGAFIRKNNHQYQSHVNVKNILSRKQGLMLSSSSKNIFYAYGFKMYNDQKISNCEKVLSRKYFEIIQKEIFKEIPNVIPKIENTKVSYVGLSLKNES